MENKVATVRTSPRTNPRFKNINVNKVTNVTPEQLLYLLERELSNKSFYEFFQLAAPILYPSVEWLYNWHYKFIADQLQEEVERIKRGDPKDKDYIINLPFRSGKSILISVIFPVWCWIKDPSLSIITVSATDALAVKFSHQSKILIDSDWFKNRFGDIFQIRQDTSAKGNYMNNKGGRRESFGINSGIIGSGCNIMLLDDIGSPDNVTPVGIKNVIESFTDVLYSRLNNPSIDIRIVLQQRIHENDISGYLLRTNPEKYNHICIPATLTPDLRPLDLHTYYQDGLFWKERFSQRVLDDFKSTLRTAPYSSQLLQRPTPEEGDIIKRTWFKTIKESEVMKLPIQWVMILDTAYTDNKKNDPSAFLIAGVYNGNLYIRKVKQLWLQFNDLIGEIKEMQKVYNINRIYIEEKASGISISQELKRQTNYNVIGLSPNGKDKTSRVMAITPSLESGRVILVEDSWNDMFLSECASFPYSAHDDMVDTLSYAVNELLNKSGKSKLITI